MLDKPAVDHGELIYTAALGHNFLGVTTRSDERCCKPNHFHTPVLPLSECGRPALPPIPPNCVLRPCYVNIEFDYSFLSFTNRLSVCVCVYAVTTCHVMFSLYLAIYIVYFMRTWVRQSWPLVGFQKVLLSLLSIILNIKSGTVFSLLLLRDDSCVPTQGR